MKILRSHLILLLFALFGFVQPRLTLAQTFRGGINGVATDQSGAVVSGAQVTALEVSTNISYRSVSSSAGEFAFSNLPLGAFCLSG
jgi:hypothetical protein